ncbi:MAG: putative glycoside hydrolase [Candidatus Baltobacteraceae bacterium]
MGWFEQRFTTCVASLLVCALAACGGGGAGGAVPAVGAQSIISVNGNNLDFTGTIDQILASGFHMQVGTGGGYNTVTTTSSTVFTGAKPYVGEAVEVIGTGSFSIAKSIVATQVKQLGVSASPSPSASLAPSPSLFSPTPAPVTLGGTTQSTAIVAPSGVMYFSGKIVQMYSTGFSFYAGTNYGNMHEVTQFSTQWAGPAPAVGDYAYITGPAQPGYWVNGSLVTITASPAASTTVSGTVNAATPYGFTLTTANGTIPVGLTSTTVIGGAPLYAGSTVTVTGIGSASISVVAVQIIVAAPAPPPNYAPTPTPGPISIVHVPTGDYLAGLYGTTAVTPAQAAPYLTWAQTDYHSASAISYSGIKTQLYVDPNREASTDPMWQYSYLTESDFAHDCGGNRITFGNSAGRYVMDPSSATLQQHFAQMVANQMSRAHFDLVWEDNAGPLGPDQAFATFSPALPCNYSDAGWIQGGLALNNGPALPVMVNGLNIPNGHATSEAMQLLSSSNTAGGNFEGCYSDVNKIKQSDWFWQVTENEELQTVALGKTFECMLRNQASAASNADARIYGYASYLLTYDPGKTTFWEEFGTTSGFHVEPESQLVALDPLTATPSDVSGLQTATGVYGREYQHCYVGGQFVSACAVEVNSDGYNPHVAPYPQYTHTLVLNGGGILDGGTMSTNGGAPPQTLAPAQAEILFP